MTGSYKHNYLSFERKWSASSEEEQEWVQSPEDSLPIPEIPTRSTNQRSGPASILRSVYERIAGHQNIQRNRPQNDRPQSDRVRASSDFTYIKTINLTLNGRPLQSLSTESATEKEDFAHYYLFAKATGSINTGKKNLN